MINSIKERDESLPEDSQPGEVGDVEAAGETTAASAIQGPTDTRPVGADTMIKVSDNANQKKPADD